MAGIKNIFGGASIQSSRPFGNVTALHEIFGLLKAGDCHTIDTAVLYGASETLLGNAKAAEHGIVVDTKNSGGNFPGGASKANILAEAKKSQKLLGSGVDILYIHVPDHGTPLDETLSAVNEVYHTGFFKRFGLSNFLEADVRRVHDHCRRKGYLLPTVYQGNYSAVARRQEEVLFPTLRELGIAFYAYSPLAGGFLTKSKEEVTTGAGRFGARSFVGEIYTSMYCRPTYIEALARWEKIAAQEQCTRADLAYRWVKYNSPLKAEYGDALIFGAGDMRQLKETLDSINRGPLSDTATRQIDELWKLIKHEAPLDNIHR